MKKLNLVGQQFGRLLVLEEDIEKTEIKKASYWFCQCQCGNKISVCGSKLKSGQTQSCGCLQRERTSFASRIDLTGQRFNHLTVIESDKLIKGQLFWKCQCDCGKIVSVRSADIRSGHTKSCGCIKSSGEEKIANALHELNICFETQKRFSELRGEHGGLLSYDFYLPELSVVIECQGKQHYQPIIWYGGENKFIEQQKHDVKKRRYCEENGYFLIEISYEDYDKINKDFLKEKIKTAIKKNLS